MQLVRTDYHIHTTYSDGRRPTRDYVEQAKRIRLDEMGFSDHVHFQKASWSMELSKLPDYVKEINTFKNDSHITVKAGLEVDFVPSKMDELMQTIDNFDFDYLIGSVHHIGDWLIDSESQIQRWKGQNIDDIYRQYFSLVQEMVKTGRFNIIGHLDLPKKFGFRPKNNITDVLLETIRVISKSDMCVEINTSGLRKPCHEIYPSQDLLKTCFDNAVPITLGSDAHSPENVAADFDHAIKLLREVGYTEIVKFSKRNKEFVEL